MRNAHWYLFLFLWSFCLQAENDAVMAFRNGDYKKAIELYRNDLNVADDKSEIKAKLALVYWKDQDQELAFRTFLEALSEHIYTENASTEDDAAYEKALKIYLDHSGGTNQAIAQKICRDFEGAIKEHPDYNKLGYVVAAAYANLGRYEDFFTLFYRSHLHHPDHFLAAKTKAVLHIKLFERARFVEEKEEQRSAVLYYLNAALEKEPRDCTLYKSLIAFSPEEKKLEVMHACLNKIIDKNIIIPRSDIGFYVEEAIGSKEFVLAQRFIDKVKEFYQFSRVVNAAQHYLDEHKSK